jgi:hypothetical protein
MDSNEPEFYYNLETALKTPEDVLRLDLHYRNLNHIPQEVSQLINLQELYL